MHKSRHECRKWIWLPQMCSGAAVQSGQARRYSKLEFGGSMSVDLRPRGRPTPSNFALTRPPSTSFTGQPARHTDQRAGESPPQHWHIPPTLPPYRILHFLDLCCRRELHATFIDFRVFHLAIFRRSEPHLPLPTADRRHKESWSDVFQRLRSTNQHQPAAPTGGSLQTVPGTFRSCLSTLISDNNTPAQIEPAFPIF